MAGLYRIRNNTDLRGAPLEFTSQRQARRAWREIKPGPGAGNAYFARFEQRCARCGGWQDVTVDHVTCDCRS